MTTMAKKKIRDSVYWERRLRLEHPTIYADYRAGRIRSVRQARKKAGLIRLPTALDEVKRAWVKLAPTEIDQFLVWLRPRVSATRKSVLDRGGHLTPDVTGFLESWLSRNRLRPGRIMERMGFKRYDYRLSEAIKRKRRLPPDVIAKLTSWLASEGY